MFRLLSLTLTMVFALAPPVSAKKLALVIGNDSYSEITPLTRAREDASGYRDWLRTEGFEIVTLAGGAATDDLSQRAMSLALARLYGAIQPGDTVAFVFSGHGWSDGVTNYLVPADTPVEGTIDELRQLTLPLRNGRTGILDEIVARGARLTFAVIDACRNNPFRAPPGQKLVTWAKGLAREAAPSGTFIAFSAAEGQTALDRLGDGDRESYSVFTRHFLRELRTGADLQSAMTRTEVAVYEEAQRVSHVQTPAQYKEWVGAPCLRERCTVGELSQPVPDPAVERMRAAEAAWDRVQESESIPALESVAQDFEGTYVASLARERIAKLRGPVPPQYLNSVGRVYSDGQIFQDCMECPELVVISAGEFEMGSPEGEAGRRADEGPQRSVGVGRFALAKTEVTFGQWAACVARGGCKSSQAPDDVGFDRGDHPVVNISWTDAQDYVAWLNDQVEGSPYRLPSEAEWEYAARAGERTAYPWGLSWDAAKANGRDGGPVRTVPVSSYPANGFGLFDMIGNVWEWTEDCWHESYAKAHRTGGPWLEAGGGGCARRVVRGGSWGNHAASLRSAVRSWNKPDDRGSFIGFRPARTLNP